METLSQLAKLFADSPWPTFMAVLVLGNVAQFIFYQRSIAKERAAHLQTAQQVIPCAERMMEMVQAAARASRMRQTGERQMPPEVLELRQKGGGQPL